MTLIATLRQRQQTQARAVFGLLLIVWLSLSLQACAAAQPETELAVDRSVTLEMPALASDHSGHENDSQCAHCIDCEHDGCTAVSCADGPVVASTQADTRPLDDIKPEMVAAPATNRTSTTVYAQRLASSASTSSTSLTNDRLHKRHCVYLI